MILVNLSHSFTEEQERQIETISRQAVESMIDVRTHFDNDQPFAEQTRRWVESAGLTAEEWQTEPLLVNLPGLSVIAALVLAELHGRCGYFPGAVRLKPVPGGTPPRFEAAEILNLQAAWHPTRPAG